MTLSERVWYGPRFIFVTLKHLDVIESSNPHQEPDINPQADNPRSSSISVVFPAFNDAGTIGSVVLSARRAVRHWTPDYEIVVVNDGSRDHTAEVLAELEQVVPELRVIHHSSNQGYGAALRTGFAAARKELLFYTDSDAQFDPQEIPRLLHELAPYVDYVSGYRTKRADSFLRVLIGNPYHRFVRWAFGLRLRDIDCDFRLFRREVIARLDTSESDGTFCIEMLKQLDDMQARFAEVPVSHYPRVYGHSQYYNARSVLGSYLRLFRLWLRLVVHRDVPATVASPPQPPAAGKTTPN